MSACRLFDAVSGPGVAVTAIGLNGYRIVATSGFGGSDGTVTLDGALLKSDYELLAVGEASNLEQSLALPGGLQATLSTLPGVLVSIEKRESTGLPAADNPVLGQQTGS